MRPGAQPAAAHRGRALQGVTGGGLQPNAQAILADAFPPHKRGQAFAVYGIAVVFAPAIGPTLGGWITDNFSWRWVFLLNVPVGILLSILAARVIVDPPDRVAALRTRFKRRHPLRLRRLRLPGASACARCRSCSTRARRTTGGRPRFITDLAIAAGAGAGRCSWSGSCARADPIVDLRLFSNRNFAIGNILMFMVGFVLLSSTVLLPLFVQSLLGYTATEAGW